MSNNHLVFVTSPVKTDFLCAACKAPWDPDAVVQCVDCEAPFCRLCYDESMMKEALCQSCSKQPATFGNVHRLVRSMAESLEVYCTFKSHGCDWTGARKDLEPHASTCAKRPKELTYVNEGAVPPELICPICSNPFVDPVQLPCEHVFCRTCITESLKRQPMCPNDRNTASLDQLSATPKIINELLDELPVYCAQRNAKPNPCSWTGRRRDYVGHKTVCKGGQCGSAPSPAPKHVTIVEPKPAPAATSDKMQIEAITEYPSIEAGNVTQEIYAMAHLTAPKLESVEQRKKPLSVSAVIDVSGSMSGSKLNMAKDSLRFMIDELSDKDELGIIAFHTNVSEPFSLGKMTPEGKAAARIAVNSLTAQSCTNLSGGLFAGMGQVRRQRFSDINSHYADGSRRSRPNSSSGSGLFQRMKDLAWGGSSNGAPLPEGAAVKIVAFHQAIRRDGNVLHKYDIEVSFADGVRTNFLTDVTVAQARGKHEVISRQAKSVTSVTETLKFSWTVSKPFDDDFCITFSFAMQYNRAPDMFCLNLKDTEYKTANKVFSSAAVAGVPAAKDDSCRAVLLFTDGVANGGITNETGLIAAFKERLADGGDLVLHTFGFGADHNASLLQKLAEAGAGSYYFIQDVATMKESFADCLGGLLSTVAQNIHLRIQALPGFSVARVMSSMPVKTDGDISTVSMRDVYSSETRDVLVKLKMSAPQPVGTKAPMVTFTVQYDSLLSGKTETTNALCAIDTSDKKYEGEPNPKIDEQRTRIEATEALDAARKQADSGDVAGARNALHARRDELRLKCKTSTAYSNAVLDDLFAVESEMVDTARWASSGSKAAAAKQSCHAQQRSNWCGDSDETMAFASYDNSFKGAMRAKSRKS